MQVMYCIFKVMLLPPSGVLQYIIVVGVDCVHATTMTQGDKGSLSFLRFPGHNEVDELLS